MLLEAPVVDKLFPELGTSGSYVAIGYSSGTSAGMLLSGYENRSYPLESPVSIEVPVVKYNPLITGDALIMLGDGAKDRLYTFMFLGDAWDGEDAKPLNQESLTTMNQFASLKPKIASPVSLFFTERGNIEILFKDSNGKSINIEFFPSGLEYFHEGLMAEGEVPRTRMSEFISSIN
jgi:hypothetical protein